MPTSDKAFSLVEIISTRQQDRHIDRLEEGFLVIKSGSVGGTGTVMLARRAFG